MALYERMQEFYDSKAYFINERYPVATDEPLPPLPPFDDTKNKPSEWLAIDDVLQVSYDPRNNYTPLDVDWGESEPLPTPQPTPTPKTRRDEDFDVGF